MLREPVGRQAGHGLQRSGLFKEMGGTGNDGQGRGPRHVRRGALVQLQHPFIARADEQQGWTLHPRQIPGRRQIRAPAAEKVGNRTSSRAQRLIQHFHPVPHGRGGTALQVGDAADVGRNNDLAAQFTQMSEFAVAQFVSHLGMQHTERAG